VTKQVNRSEGLAIAAVLLPVIAAFIGLSTPRELPLPSDIPAPHLSRETVAADEKADLRRIESMHDSVALQVMDRAFGWWNQSEGSPSFGGGGALVDSSRALRQLGVAYQRLSADERRAFLADRSERLLGLVHRIRKAVARNHEDREAVHAMRLLVGGRFEDRAVQSGLLDADDVVLRAAFKLRLVLTVEPSDVRLVSRTERIAFHGFIAARARGQSVMHRLASVEELAKLDRQYPAALAAAQLLAMAGEWDAAATRLQATKHPSVRTRNHLLWLARQQKLGR